MSTAVIYARFSSSKQREASIEDQLRVCREYCEREKIDVVGQYCDYAMSGRTDERPEFQRMIANAGESDYVVCWMLDRFSRDPYDAPIYKKQLKKKGVTVLSALERVEDSPDGIIMEKLLEGLAARESMVTSIRTKRGMEGNAKKCLYNGDRVFGYAVDETRHYVVDEAQAAYVREAFARRLNREAVNSIAADFARRGVKTYAGNPCSSTMVSNILKNEKYTGVYTWGDVRVEGGMPQIVDKATFDAVQCVRGRKQRKMEHFERYALSGKAVCGKCGMGMTGVSCHNHQGRRYDYYRCSQRCGARQVRRDKYEGIIVDELRKILAGDEAYKVARIVQEAWVGSDRHLALDDAKKRLKAAQDGKKNLNRAVIAGMPWEAVKDDFERLAEQEERAQHDIAVHSHDAEFGVDDFVDFLRFGATLDDATLLDAFVSQVVVFDDRMVVTLNYDAQKTHPEDSRCVQI